jgi:hypothetical protein
MENRKTKKFKALIFSKYGQHKSYDDIILNMTNIRENLNNTHIFFINMSAKSQYDLCVTIMLITIQTLSQHINENMPLSLPEDKKYPYSMNRSGKAMQTISLDLSLIQK